MNNTNSNRQVDFKLIYYLHGNQKGFFCAENFVKFLLNSYILSVYVLNREGIIIRFEFDYYKVWLIISVLRCLSLRKVLHNVQKTLVIENNFYCLKITAS